MSEGENEICRIIGSDDPAILEFIKNIKSKTQGREDFEQRLLDLNVGLTRDLVTKIYDVLSAAEKVPKHDSSDILLEYLREELKCGNDDLELLKKFIEDTLQKSDSWNEFKSRMSSMGSGLSENTLRRIFLIGKTKKLTHIHSNLPQGASMGDEKKLKIETPKKDNQLAFNSHIKDVYPVLNKIYKVKIKRVMTFGCFAEIQGIEAKNIDGLIHISEMTRKRIKDPYDIVIEGQEVFAKVIKVHPDGKISLSMRDVDQNSGEDLESSLSEEVKEPRGRKRGVEMEQGSSNLQKRRLTSPERWEIRQLIASGAASIEDYPDLDLGSEMGSHNGTNAGEEDEGMEVIDVEINTASRPNFLRSHRDQPLRKADPVRIIKAPRGSMNRAAMNGSNILRTHREEKLAKKKEIEQEIRRLETLDDPTRDPKEVRKEIASLKRDLIVTEWERSRLHEHITFGKRNDRPISEQRRSLPIYQLRGDLMKAIRENQFLVIIGETGSGKTTQITQYLGEEGFSKLGIIGCTQPRRVAAISVAKRVAEEVGCRLGSEVGFAVRFEDVTSKKTKIKYMTDGILLMEAISDPLMSKYSVIMLDEAHERTVATDILFGLLKKAAEKRPDLKVVVTSATLDATKFSQYFNNCPVIHIPGKTFPVKVLYSRGPQMDYIEAALECVMNIHINNEPGDILVFLTGQEEIDSCCEILYQKVKALGSAIGTLQILPVYSALPSEIQSKIFEPTPEGVRKVVFATNIAETSITIDGIYYVVDPGFVKVNTYNARTGMEHLVVTPISQAQANQRKGRAGRTGPGVCYRLYTESSFHNEMLPNSIPEIQRKNLCHTILMLKAMGIDDLLNFDFMDPPPRNIMVAALKELYYLEALDNDGNLTELGRQMSKFPMDPNLSRVLLSSVTNGCSDEVSTIIGMLTVASVFYRPKEKQQEADIRKARFYHPYGDHLTLLNVYNRWKESGYSNQFCTNNFLYARHLRRSRDVKKQICTILEKMNLSITSCHGDPDAIRRAFVSGFFMNAAKRDPQGGYLTLVGNMSVGIHPSSSLFGKDYDYVIYHSLVVTSREYMSQVTCINSEWLAELASHFYKLVDPKSASRKRFKIAPLHNRFAKDQNSWRLSSIRQTRERALGSKK